MKQLTPLHRYTENKPYLRHTVQVGREFSTGAVRFIFDSEPMIEQIWKQFLTSKMIVGSSAGFIGKPAVQLLVESQKPRSSATAGKVSKLPCAKEVRVSGPN